MVESVGFIDMCIRVRVHADVPAVCAHAVVGSCCQLCSSLHTLSSGSSLHATAQSIYRRMRVYKMIVFVRITGWDMQCIQVRGHEGLCVRARARVCRSRHVGI